MPNIRTIRSTRSRAGFTLIEVMITVAIIAILASVAMPAYQGYVRRGQLTEAFTTLSDMRVKMEQYYQDNKYYGASNAVSTCPALPGYGAFPYANKYFNLTCAADATVPSQTFTLTATGSGTLTAGYAYTLNQTGAKRTTEFAGGASTAACWLGKSNTCDN